MPVQQHPHAPWRKLILVPCWIIQSVFGVAFLILLSLRLGTVIPGVKVNLRNSALRHTLNIFAPIEMAIVAVSFVLNVVEIYLLSARKLKPWPFVILNLIKSTVWTALLVLNVLSVSQGDDGAVSIWVAVANSILLISFYIPLIYSTIIICRKVSIYKAVSISLMHHGNAPPKQKTHDSWNSFASYSTSNTIYISPEPEQIPEILVNTTSNPSTPIASDCDPEAHIPYSYSIVAEPQATEMTAATSHAVARKLSYNHTRDPRFDQYLARRPSAASRYNVVSGGRRASGTWADTAYRGTATSLDARMPSPTYSKRRASSTTYPNGRVVGATSNRRGSRETSFDRRFSTGTNPDRWVTSETALDRRRASSGASSTKSLESSSTSSMGPNNIAGTLGEYDGMRGQGLGIVNEEERERDPGDKSSWASYLHAGEGGRREEGIGKAF